MFKFNFNVDNNCNKKETKNSETAQEPDTGVDLSIPCGIKHLQELKSTLQDPQFMRISLNEPFNTKYLKCVDSYKTELNKNEDDDDDELNQINKTHDIVAGRYEGGLKIWELSVDLARFIFNVDLIERQMPNADDRDVKSVQLLLDSAFTSDEFRILEIGCGHALPTLSVLAYLQSKLDKLTTKSKTFKIVVYLQDFNKKIIETITYENVNEYLKENEKSFAEKNVSLEVKFVFGDWKRILNDDLLPSDYFNIILTSETIYNCANYHSLLGLFSKSMSKKSSMVLLAAKTYYFGCGGNSHEFIQLAKSTKYRFDCSPNLLSLYERLYLKLNKLSQESIENTIAKEIIKMELIMNEVYA